MSCSSGKVWNQAVMKCDLPINVDCAAQAKMYMTQAATTTTKTTTKTTILPVADFTG